MGRYAFDPSSGLMVPSERRIVRPLRNKRLCSLMGTAPMFWAGPTTPNMVVLLVPGTTDLSDISSNAIVPTTTGTITSSANPDSFAANSLTFTSGALNYAKYTKVGGFLPNPTGDVCVECFIDINDNPACAASGGPAGLRAGFLVLKKAGVSQFMLGACCISGTQNCRWGPGGIGAANSVAWNQTLRHHVGFQRVGGVTRSIIDGVFSIDAGAAATLDFDEVFIGNVSTDNPVGGFEDQIRITQGIQYTGATNYTVPVAPLTP